MDRNGGALAHSLPWTKRALVLAGGGLAGIAWETGILRGIADESPGTAKALLDVDVLVGTSAGSTVAAQLGSGLGLDALFDRQTTASSTELNPNVGVDEITELFVTAMLTPNTTKAEKLQKIGAVALSTADRHRSGAPRRDRAAAAVARLAGPGAADLRDRHRDGRAGRRSTGTRASAWSTRSPPAARCRASGRR